MHLIMRHNIKLFIIQPKNWCIEYFIIKCIEQTHIVLTFEFECWYFLLFLAETSFFSTHYQSWSFSFCHVLYWNKITITQCLYHSRQPCDQFNTPITQLGHETFISSHPADAGSVWHEFLTVGQSHILYALAVQSVAQVGAPLHTSIAPTR